MRYILLLCVVLALAVAINCVSVYAQKRYRYYDRFAHGWAMHSLVILPAWTLFIILAVRLNEQTYANFQPYKWTGALIMVVAIALFCMAIRMIGTQAISNGNFFGRGKVVHGGVYKYLQNPIYDSYWMLLAGTGLYVGNWAYFVLAAESFVALNIIETYVERIDTPPNSIKCLANTKKPLR